MRCICLKRQNEPNNKIIRIPFESEKVCILILYDGSKHTTLEVLYKLLISFHMQRKRLGLPRTQIFNQRIFFGGGVGGVGKAIWRIVRTSEKILATPLSN